jgi:hypothetical protein
MVVRLCTACTTLNETVFLVGTTKTTDPCDPKLVLVPNCRVEAGITQVKRKFRGGFSERFGVLPGAKPYHRDVNPVSNRPEYTYAHPISEAMFGQNARYLYGRTEG